MSNNKEHSVMGFSKASCKRKWPGEVGEDFVQSPSKVVCKSPTINLRSEDAQLAPPAFDTSDDTSEAYECEITPLPMDDCHDNEEEALATSDCEETASDHPNEKDDDDENFIDDEEDKDSGFIDGNSIDNSSDDDMDIKEGEHNFSTSSDRETKQKGGVNVGESDLQLSLSKVLLMSSVTCEEDSLPPNVYSPTTSSTRFSGALETVTDDFFNPSASVELKKSEPSITTVTAAQTGTIVTNSYHGSVSTPTYDIHSYPASYTTDLYQPRPCTPSWSCTFYDGSQPTTTNKYMEISPNRTLTSQSIQCDENGKSYIELGSAPPFTYSNECGSFTTSSSSYQGPYTQSFPNAPYSPPPPNSYFSNTRQGYNSPSYNYHNASGEPYGHYEGDGSGCSYGYINESYVPANMGRPPPSRLNSQRCSSAICDPTRTTPRPACYHQQRLSVLNLSMFKLNRFSRFPEPSLHRSVLICNTLRHIEKELETEGISMTALLAHSHSQAYGAPGIGGGNISSGAGTPDSLPSLGPHIPHNEGPMPPLNSAMPGSPILPPPSPSRCLSSESHFSNREPSLSYSHSQINDHHAMNFESRDDQLSPISNQAITPVERPPLVDEDDPSGTQVSPPTPRVPSSLCDSGINWCSVLSLSSQTDLDSMNNNECNDWSSDSDSSSLCSLTRRSEPLVPSSSESSLRQQFIPHSEDTAVPAWKLPSLSADDVLKSFPEAPRRNEEDLDSIIKVLVGS